jgi:anti-sigma factor RsiW
MRCPTAKRKMTAFLDGELPIKEREALSMHLESCEKCRIELNQMSEVSDYLDLVKEVTPPPFLAARVKQRIKDLKKAERYPLPLFGRAGRAGLATAAVAVLSVSVLVGGRLGRGIYELKADRASREEVEIVDFLGMGSFDGASEGSLVSAYNDLLTAEGD